MSAAQPLSLDALRRLIADNDYWNPHSAQHKELQRKVSEGFGRLYPANGNAAEISIERDRLDDDGESIRQMQRRYNEVFSEYGDLLKRYEFGMPEYNEDGLLVKDYEPIPAESKSVSVF